jgi:hypothetical protein
MLTGKAKTDYMRDYMRRKRAGLITPRPKRDPVKRMVSEIGYWMRVSKRRPHHLSAIGQKVIKGLTLDTGDEAQWRKAIRRLERIRKQQKADREHKDKVARYNGPLLFCCCCGDVKMPDGVRFITIDEDKDLVICDPCADKVLRVVARARRAPL